MLLRSVSIAQLPKFDRRLNALLPKIDCEEDAVLLGYAKLSNERVQEVLRSPYTPDKVRARLGDPAARARVVRRFQKADNFNVTPPNISERRRLADIVFLIDTSSSMQPKIDGVRSNCIAFANALAPAGPALALRR